jgi:GT2 family glycosyltransferase
MARWFLQLGVLGKEALFQAPRSVMSAAAITAIVPVWNGRDVLSQLLDTLEKQTHPAELLIVDNGSEDGAPEMACKRGARVVSMGHNAGFSAAVNRGIHETRTPWIAVLNSDVELAPDYFEKLLAAAEASYVWFATGKILAAGSPERIDGAFDLLCRGGCALRVGNGRPDGPVFSLQREVWSVPWTAALFRAELFQRAGVLEEGFESYLEDVDFGVRCAAHRLSGLYVPEAVAWHQGSAALGRWHAETVRRIARNQVLLVARHYPRQLLRQYFWPIWVSQVLWGAVALRHGHGWAWARGKYEGLRAFRAARTRGEKVERDMLAGWLNANERIIGEFQRSCGFNLYWRLYFLLTGGAK